MRVLLAGTAEARRWERIKAELARLEPRMLTGEEKFRGEPDREERLCDRSQFDGFGPGADDQPNVRVTQPSP
jgi:hypothetical protein